MTTAKPFDLVVHGATGFTGRLVVEYLLQRYPAGSGLRWAMGGRSADKLAAVRDEVGAPADTPLIVTDSADPASLQALPKTMADPPAWQPLTAARACFFDGRRPTP